MNGSQAIIESLLQADIQLMAGVSGDSVMSILDALYDHQDRLRFVGVRHEQVAAHLVDGYARATRRPAVALGHVGPGVCNHVIGIASAFRDSVPMILLTGAQESGKLGRDAWHEIDQLGLLKPVTKWSARAVRADDLPRLMRSAIHQATHGRPGPVHIDVPKDVQKQSLSEAAVAELQRGEQAGFAAAPRPAADAVRRTVALLRAAARPIFLAGAGAYWAGAEHALRELVELTGIPVATGVKARGILPEDHPLCLGPVGHFGLKGTCDALAECDFVLALGSRLSDLTTVNWSLIRDDARVVQVDIAPNDLGRQYPVTLAVLADAKAFVEDLLAELREHPIEARPPAGDEFVQRAQARRQEEVESILAGSGDGAPVKPQRIMRDVMATLPRDAFVSVAGGIHSGFANKIDVFTPGAYLKSVALGAMGSAVPYAMGAKLAFPDRVAVALTGDGDFAMIMQDLETCVRERIPVVTVIFNDSSFAILKVFQNAFYGGRIIGSDFNNIPFYKFAELVGAQGSLVERGEDFRPALERAIQSGLPAILDVQVDPAEIGPTGFTVQRFHAHTGG